MVGTWILTYSKGRVPNLTLNDGVDGLGVLLPLRGGSPITCGVDGLGPSGPYFIPDGYGWRQGGWTGGGSPFVVGDGPLSLSEGVPKRTSNELGAHSVRSERRFYCADSPNQKKYDT